MHSPHFDVLERRLAFSVGFASAGLSYNSSDPDQIEAVVYSVEGTLGDQDVAGFANAAGSMYVSDDGGRSFDGDIVYDRLLLLADGRFVRDPDEGRRGEPDESNGVQFLNGRGFPAGWWFGDFGTGGNDAGQELEFIVEQPTGAVLGDMAGDWRFSVIGVDYELGEFFSSSGQLSITGSRVDFDEDLGVMPRATSFIHTFSASGRGVTGSAEYLYLSADGRTLLIADMNDEEGVVYVGVAVRADLSIQEDDVVGGYYLSWAVTAADQQASNPIRFRQLFLDLEADGDYRIYDLDEYDDGARIPIERGYWSLAGSSLRLAVRDSEAESRLVLSNDGRTLLGFRASDQDFIDPVLGLGTRAATVQNLPPLVITVPDTQVVSRPVVYELRTDEAWRAVDLVASAGGPAVTGDVVTWRDPKDGLSYGAAVTDQGLTLYRGATTGVWTVRNLMQEQLGNETIVRSLAVMISPDRLVSLVGLSSAGELLRYYQSGRLTNTGEFAYLVSNIYDEELAPDGETRPVFVGDLVAYATSWGGLNVAGLDAQGRIWSVWWAPGLESWSSTNLSETTGAPELVGGLTVYLTPWNGINLAGVDDAGEVRVTWWVPGFGTQWRENNLTEEFSGPGIAAGSLTSFVAAWGGLNLVGIEAATGEVVSYWWSPERTELGWAVVSLSDEVGTTAPDITGEVTGLAASDESLNVFGRALVGLDSHMVRYYWEPGFSAWTWQDVTDEAG
ncbi:MAG: hypothetical protein H7Y88_03490 [Phycisphaerales bacterium]|nr:hypothetical protein [Phycisphaerales bacterium]